MNKDLTQINRDVVAALEKNGIKNPAVVVTFTEPNTNYKQVFWVSNTTRADSIKLIKGLLERLISKLN